MTVEMGGQEGKGGARVDHDPEVGKTFRLGDPTPGVSDRSKSYRVRSGALIKRVLAGRGVPCLSLEPHQPQDMLI